MRGWNYLCEKKLHGMVFIFQQQDCLKPVICHEQIYATKHDLFCLIHKIKWMHLVDARNELQQNCFCNGVDIRKMTQRYTLKADTAQMARPDALWAWTCTT